VAGDRKRRGKPQRVGRVVAEFLDTSGLAARIDQAAIVPEWPTIVGSQIGAVTKPLRITADGTLFVVVETNAWMTELSLLEPQILAAINRAGKGAPIKKIRWQARG
jgi:predicted nucleic acid-binding Zn ribbon protein